MMFLHLSPEYKEFSSGQQTVYAGFFWFCVWLEHKLKWFSQFSSTDLARFVACLLQIPSVYF